MVTSTATESDLHLEPVPNPAYFLNVSDLEYLADEHPEAIKKMWDFSGALPTLQLVSDRIEEAATELGYEVVHRSEYNPGGEANWKPFVQAAADAGAEAIFWVGEPENLVAMLEAAAEIGFTPEFVRADANHYTPTLIELGGAAVDPVITRMGFYPFELADENPATTHYLQLMEEFNPDGKVALLGAQGLSGWLLFVTAANECDAAGTFTRDCIFEAAKIERLDRRRAPQPAERPRPDLRRLHGRARSGARRRVHRTRPTSSRTTDRGSATPRPWCP